MCRFDLLNKIDNSINMSNSEVVKIIYENKSYIYVLNQALELAKTELEVIQGGNEIPVDEVEEFREFVSGLESFVSKYKKF